MLKFSVQLVISALTIEQISIPNAVTERIVVQVRAQKLNVLMDGSAQARHLTLFKTQAAALVVQVNIVTKQVRHVSLVKLVTFVSGQQVPLDQLLQLKEVKFVMPVSIVLRVHTLVLHAQLVPTVTQKVTGS